MDSDHKTACKVLVLGFATYFIYSAVSLHMLIADMAAMFAIPAGSSDLPLIYKVPLLYTASVAILSASAAYALLRNIPYKHTIAAATLGLACVILQLGQQSIWQPMRQVLSNIGA